MTSTGQSSSPMEPSAGRPCPHGGDAPAVISKKLWRGMQAAYLVLVKKHQPRLAALGVHLHSLLSGSQRRRRRRSRLAALEREESPALVFLSALSCRSMDPAAAVVHPYPRGRHGHRRARHGGAASSLSCRSMDPAAAVCRYQYRPREVEFSCKSTPLHKRRREEKRRQRLQSRAAAAAADKGHADDHPSSEPAEHYYYGSAAAVTRLFALMDVEEEVAGSEAAAGVVGYYDDGDLDPVLDAAAAWPALAAVGYAPRQVRITDSPYLGREEGDNEEVKSAVDRRADEFITWFHEQLRTQQQRSTRNWVR